MAAAFVATTLPFRADAAPASRIIVSSTLNHGLLVLDAETLAFTQPLLPSRGTSPVRMDVATLFGHRYLFTANHGIAGSLGIFDLSGDVILEAPQSPIPTGGFGSVGIDVGMLSEDMAGIAVTNTWFALGGCGMPNGSVSLFEVYVRQGQVIFFPVPYLNDLQGAIPYAVAIDDNRGAMYVSTNCGNEVEIFDLEADYPPAATPITCYSCAPGTSTRVPIGNGPDATLFDPGRDRSYTVNIGGDSLSVIDGASRKVVTTVPLPNAGPIDATLATSAGGQDWILTSNGQDDTFSIVSRDIIEDCVAANAASCPEAEVARIDAGVDGGAPEGVTYDARSGRAFIVNKSPLGSPSLSAVQVDESGLVPTGTFVRAVPLPAVDPALPVPSIIAFDVVVDDRGA